MAIEAVVAIGSGVAAGSLTLTAFGLDSVIELISAGVLIWRLTDELRRGEEFSRRAERIAARSGGALLFVLAAYIVLGAGWSLWAHHGGGFSVPGLIVGVLAMPIMYILARWKLNVARQIGSPAMRADAIESITCGWLSLVVVVGLIANVLLAAWWVDPVTSLVSSGSSSKKCARRGPARTAAAMSEAITKSLCVARTSAAVDRLDDPSLHVTQAQ